MLKAAVIGVGHLGKIHARIYRELPDVELVGVVDSNAQRGQEVAERCACKYFANSSELLDKVDLISVAVPTVAHCEVALPFLQKGIAVLVEKPIAASLKEADLLVAAARKSGAALAVGHVERFNPAIQAIRELKIKPRFIESHRLAPFSFRSTDIGVVLDLMIHDLDLILELVDAEIESVEAVGGSMLTEREDLASARIRFRNGAVANITASRVSLKPMRRMRIFSPAGYVSLDFEQNYAILVKKGPKFDEKRKAMQNINPGQVNPFEFFMDGAIQLKEMKLEHGQEPLRVELEAFVAAVREKRDPVVTGEDGRRALAAAYAVLDQIANYSW